MRTPSPTTYLALELAKRMKTKAFSGDWEIASDTTRAVSIAGKVRRLVELGCNRQLLPREDARRTLLKKRADAILKPYGLRLGNPWGLCFYALPIGHDCSSQNGCIYLA